MLFQNSFLVKPIKLQRAVIKFTMGNRTGSGTHHSTCPPFPSSCEHLPAAISHFFLSIQANVPSPTDLFILLVLARSPECLWCSQSICNTWQLLPYLCCLQTARRKHEKKKKSQPNNQIPNNSAPSSCAWHSHSEATQEKSSSAPQLLCWTSGPWCPAELLPCGARCSTQLSMLCWAEEHTILTAEKLPEFWWICTRGERRRKQYVDSQVVPSLS